jgi:hypothetical protein
MTFERIKGESDAAPGIDDKDGISTARRKALAEKGTGGGMEKGTGEERNW